MGTNQPIRTKGVGSRAGLVVFVLGSAMALGQACGAQSADEAPSAPAATGPVPQGGADLGAGKIRWHDEVKRTIASRGDADSACAETEFQTECEGSYCASRPVVPPRSVPGSDDAVTGALVCSVSASSAILAGDVGETEAGSRSVVCYVWAESMAARNADRDRIGPVAIRLCQETLASAELGELDFVPRGTTASEKGGPSR